ncbi:MAG: 1-deoxy-D-xylulose-5-phosphate reductoisomerase, partial [Chlamydiia bacterium]|nr:1-deoxy-D-xylulose-5-phosphate reductoisomerase [Chlamydiia bacterium]
MRKLAILGSTGSIGTSTLDVVRNLGSDAVSVVALAAYSNIDLLEQQALEFRPDIIAVYDSSAAGELQQRLPTQRIVAGMEGVIAAATHDDADMVMSAMVGTMGLTPTVEAIRAGKDIALANKEALVSGGQLV